MLKPLTLSVSLAVALGACGVSMAGHHGNDCSTCGLASPQYPTGQSILASPQCGYGGCGGDVCGNPCGRRKSCLSGLFQHRPKCYTYEWVLKKKRVWGHHGGGCGGGGCDICGGPIGGVYPTGQYAPAPSGQYSSPQVYGAGQAGASGQGTAAPGGMTPAPSGDEAPPPPATEGAAAPSTPESAPPSTPPQATAPQSSLLFLNPTGN